MSSREIFHWYYKNYVETSTERIVSPCIFETDNRFELMSGENKAHTRKIEQCYIFSFLMPLKKKIFPMSEMLKRNPSGKDSVMINEIAWSPWPIKLDFILL